MSTAPLWNASRLAQLVRAFVRRPFVRDVGILQLGALASAGIGFVASILLARLLRPEEYGAYALVVSIGTTIGLLRRLGQDQAATTRLVAALARADAEGVRRSLSYFVAIGVWSTLVVLPIAIVLSPFLTDRWYGDGHLGTLLQLYLVPGFWVVIPATTILALQATRRIWQLTWLENGINVLTAIGGVAGALVSATAALVLVGQAAAAALSAVIGAITYQWLRQHEAIVPKARKLARGIIQPDFPVWADTRSGLSMAIDKNLASLYPLAPMLILGAVAPTTEVAQLRIALSYIAIPALLLGPISRLLMVKLPDVHTRTPERLREFFVSVSGAGGAASTALTIPFLVLAPLAIPLLYGQTYSGSVPLVLILGIDSALFGLGLTAGPLFRTLERTDLPIRVHVVVLLLGVPLGYLATAEWGATAAAASYVTLMFALRLITNIICWRLLTR